MERVDRRRGGAGRRCCRARCDAARCARGGAMVPEGGGAIFGGGGGEHAPRMRARRGACSIRELRREAAAQAAHRHLERVQRAVGPQRDRLAVEDRAREPQRAHRRHDLGRAGGDVVERSPVGRTWSAGGTGRNQGDRLVEGSIVLSIIHLTKRLTAQSRNFSPALGRRCRSNSFRTRSSSDRLATRRAEPTFDVLPQHGANPKCSEPTG